MIPLPTMNRICKYWNLPTEFQEACEYYFLRNYSDADFVSLVSMDENGNPVIREYGINFEILFQGDAAKVYTRNGERKEPNNTHYWCSFRSLTFEFGGRKETKSFVLVQVDKKAGIGESRDGVEKGLSRKASGAAGAIHPHLTVLGSTTNSNTKTKHLGYVSRCAKTPLSSADALAEYERMKELKGDSE